MEPMNRFRLTITTRSVVQTRLLGGNIGKLISQPLVIALIGDLGSGKTAFVQGLAKGLQVPAEYYITSPTFTLINEYEGRLTFHHVDLYRIGHPAEAVEIGLYDTIRGTGVTAIEWPEKILAELPQDRLQIHFEITDAQSRRLSLHASGPVAVAVLRTLAKSVEETKWG
jgi:tRNA threonylcarbamoyladenosine biosynthesis protein TsaE